MSMRVRDLQQYLGKFTKDEKGTAISDCHLYVETASAVSYTHLTLPTNREV